MSFSNEEMMKPKLKELITASFEYEEYSPVQTKILLLNAMFFIAIIINLIFMFFNLFVTQRYSLFLVNFSFLLLILYSLYLLREKENHLAASYIGLVALSVTFLAMAILRHGENYTLVWSYFFVPYAILIFGARRGLIFSFAFIVTILTITFYGIYTWESTNWNMLTFARFSLAHFVMLYIIYAIQNSTERANLKIEKLREKEKSQLKLLEKLSVTDTLTSLYNRRFFEDIFPKQIEKAEKQKALLVYFTLDLDHFKQYNDTYGHQKGDWALAQFSDVFKKVFNKRDDYIFRMGGEEFACIFLEYTNERTYKRIDDMQKALRDRNIEHLGKTPKGVLSCSIGAYIKKPYDTCGHTEIYRLADEALYRAKKQGRNKVIYA